MTLRWHWKQCQNFSEGQTFSRGLPGSTPPAVFSLWVCGVKTVGASSWCQEPAWNMANVFFLPNSQHSVLHRVDIFPFMYVRNTFAFSLFPVGPYLFHYIQFSKHVLSPYCVQGTPLILLCLFLHHINVIALLEVNTVSKRKHVSQRHLFLRGNIIFFITGFYRNIPCYWGLNGRSMGRTLAWREYEDQESSPTLMRDLQQAA